MINVVVFILSNFGFQRESTKTGEMTSYEYELQRGSISPCHGSKTLSYPLISHIPNYANTKRGH